MVRVDPTVVVVIKLTDPLANRKGNPFKLKLGAGDVVKGWEMGVTGMSVQGERRIIVPANLGHVSRRRLLLLKSDWLTLITTRDPRRLLPSPPTPS